MATCWKAGGIEEGVATVLGVAGPSDASTQFSMLAVAVGGWRGDLLLAGGMGEPMPQGEVCGLSLSDLFARWRWKVDVDGRFLADIEVLLCVVGRSVYGQRACRDAVSGSEEVCLQA